MTDAAELPAFRGRLTSQRKLADLTWLRVGGPADWLFQPADEDDLSDFMRDLDPSLPVFPMGVGSNLIVRDGGIRGVVVRLGRAFAGISVEGGRVRAGAAALEAASRCKRRKRSRPHLHAHRSRGPWAGRCA